MRVITGKGRETSIVFVDVQTSLQTGNLDML
jgi:hypothetical protein